ncbi:1-phosphofructokinase/tagatose 6-phosphate kinase [Paenibacillus taihuensis]|uniref:Tagatose-6-phosphate kinase n=1 Tax=Paenibacillus taihuensis TaxID=1156355 RepID=A0A3D9RRJ2_9BACL|nr:1-phosphofructokinase family hexose kinase [Paenibacillus taihuensis]REE78594.1 1-phosphofructokinase/tagatose 6-phosphate kinase [Paenibacillus taihuensis]
MTVEGKGGSPDVSIVCVSLNTAIDKRLLVPGLQLGAVNRAVHVDATAGGKGLNVARAAQSLGTDVLAVGFAGGSNGDWIRGKLDMIGLPHQMVPIAGESRICLNMIDEYTSRSTEVLEPGPEILAAEKEQFLALWHLLCKPGRWLTLSGSLPRGLGDGFYAELVALAREVGAFVVLDTSGKPLKLGVAGGPHTVKPNEEEFRQWCGADPRDHAAVRRVAEELGSDYGVQTLLVSLGREGCLAAKPDGRLWLAVPPAVDAVNPVGSGDSFVAGWTVACSRGLGVPDALRCAVAAGTVNAMSPGTGEVSRDAAEAMASRVIVTEL